MKDYYKEDDMEEQLNLSDEEATWFHYFKLHDYDNNDKLDGLELYTAIEHYAGDHHDEEETGENGEHRQTFKPDHQQVIQIVDTVLEMDDFNDDGFVDYYEFIKVQKDATAKSKEASA